MRDGSGELFGRDDADPRAGSAGRDGASTPLADRMRPRSLDEVVGQDHLTGTGGILRRSLAAGKVPSLVLWGPPGAGKTTLARLLAQAPGYRWAAFSAVLSGVAEIRNVVKAARHSHDVGGVKTLLFVDEIHRFNRSQQDAFRPHVEEGRIVLVGATTENPSFEVNSALLSRLHVLTLKPLDVEHLEVLTSRVLEDGERGLGKLRMALEPDAKAALLSLADGDARQLYNMLETLSEIVEPDAGGGRVVCAAHVRRLRDRVAIRGDRAGEEHFNLISALQKSIRGSDPDAGLYWLARLLEAGEDPLYVARRLVRTASEDVGLADPNALAQAMAARDAVHFIGMPEGALSLAQATVYLALAPKSNSLDGAYRKAVADVREEGSLPVPLHLRNATTPLMEGLGYGKGYRYPHAFPGGWVKEAYRPERIQGRRYYEPGPHGMEPRSWNKHIERIREAARLQDEGGGPPPGEPLPG